MAECVLTEETFPAHGMYIRVSTFHLPRVPVSGAHGGHPGGSVNAVSPHRVLFHQRLQDVAE